MNQYNQRDGQRNQRHHQTNAEHQRQNQYQNMQTQSQDEEGSISLVDEMSTGPRGNQKQLNTAQTRDQDQHRQGAHQQFNQDEEEQYNKMGTNTHQNSNLNAKSSPREYDYDHTHSGYQEVQVAEYSHEESGEPDVVDMTEDEINMEVNDGDVAQTGPQKFFDNTDQILTKPQHKNQNSNISTGVVGTKEKKIRGKTDSREFTPGKNLRDCIAQSLLEESQQSFNLTNNQQLQFNNNLHYNATIISNDKINSFVQPIKQNQQLSKSKLSKKVTTKPSVMSKHTESFSQPSVTCSVSHKVNVRNAEEQKDALNVLTKSGPMTTKFNQPQSLSTKNQTYLKKFKQSTAKPQSSSNSFLNQIQSKMKKPNAVVNTNQSFQQKSIIKTSNVKQQIAKNQKAPTLNKSASNKEVTNSNLQNPILQQKIGNNPTLTLSGITPLNKIRRPSGNVSGVHQSAEKIKPKQFKFSMSEMGSVVGLGATNNTSGPSLNSKGVGASINPTKHRKLMHFHKKSVVSNQSVNSRFNIQPNNRPNNNPFNDIQSFSSNGMGQILGLQLTNRAGKQSDQNGFPQQNLPQIGTSPELMDRDSINNGFEDDKVSLGSKGDEDQRNANVLNQGIMQLKKASHQVNIGEVKNLGILKDKKRSIQQVGQGLLGHKQKQSVDNTVNKASINLLANSEGWASYRSNDSQGINDKHQIIKKPMKADIKTNTERSNKGGLQKTEEEPNLFSPKVKKPRDNAKYDQGPTTDKQGVECKKLSPITSEQKLGKSKKSDSALMNQDEGLNVQINKQMNNNQSVANLHQSKNPLVQLKDFDKNFQSILEEKSDITKTHSKQPSKQQSLWSPQVVSDAAAPDENNEDEFRNNESNHATCVNSPINVQSSQVEQEQSQAPQQVANGSSANPQQPSSSIGVFSSLSRPGQQASGTQQQIQNMQEQILEESHSSDPQYPLSAKDAIKHFNNVLNDYEKQELHQFDNQIYYLGQNCKRKIKGHVLNLDTPERQAKSAQYIQKHKERLKQMNIFNHGYDDDQGDYQVILKDHLGYRYECLKFLGQGSFGQAIQCLDHKTNEYVAIKIIRNKKKFQYQAGIELRILKYLNYHDKYDMNNVIRVKDFMVFRKHLLIAFECLSINLYEFIKNNNFQGVSQNLIRRFAIQILQALKYQKDHRIIHCDLKPENILLKQQNKSGIKVIDYGSSCFIGQRIYTYIQSRFYRAPEIILGIPFTMAIDMWSFGCILAELYTGYPLFPGENEADQLAYIMEICGVPDRDVLGYSSRKHLFFDSNDEPIITPNSRGKVRVVNSKSLESVLNCSEELFIDFLKGCLKWSPMERMTPLQALQHPWIHEGLPEKVLQHHIKMFNQPEDNKLIKKATRTDIQGFPANAQSQSIYDIVSMIRAEEEAREKKRLMSSLNMDIEIKQLNLDIQKSPNNKHSNRISPRNYQNQPIRPKPDPKKHEANPALAVNLLSKSKDKPVMSTSGNIFDTQKQQKQHNQAATGRAGDKQNEEDHAQYQNEYGKFGKTNLNPGQAASEKDSNKKLGNKRNSIPFNQKQKGKLIIETSSPNALEKKNLQKQYKTINVGAKTTTHNEAKFHGKPLITTSPAKQGKSPKKVRSEDEDQQISISVEVASKKDRKLSNDTDKQYFAKKNQNQQLLKSVKESFGTTTKRISKISGVANDILDKSGANMVENNDKQQNTRNQNIIHQIKSKLSPARAKLSPSIQNKNQAKNIKLSSVEYKPKPMVQLTSQGYSEGSSDKDADDTLDEETIIKDVGSERINERMKMQSQIKSQLDFEQLSKQPKAVNDNHLVPSSIASYEQKHSKFVSQVQSQGPFFNEYDKKDTELNVDYDEEDSFEENMDISENLHFSAQKQSKDSMIPDEQQIDEAAEPQSKYLSAISGISPKVRKKNDSIYSQQRTNKIPSSIMMKTNSMMNKQSNNLRQNRNSIAFNTTNIGQSIANIFSNPFNSSGGRESSQPKHTSAVVLPRNNSKGYSHTRQYSTYTTYKPLIQNQGQSKQFPGSTKFKTIEARQGYFTQKPSIDHQRQYQTQTSKARTNNSNLKPMGSQPHRESSASGPGRVNLNFMLSKK